MSFLRIATVIAVATVSALAGTVVAGIVGEPSHAAGTTCKDLPFHWAFAGEIDYSPHDGTVSLHWHPHASSEEDQKMLEEIGLTRHVSATVAISDVECQSQEGLAEFVSDIVAADRETRKNSCMHLEQLVSIVEATYGLSKDLRAPTLVEVTPAMEMEALRNVEALRSADDAVGREAYDTMSAATIEAGLERLNGGESGREVDVSLMQASVERDCGDDLGVDYERRAIEELRTGNDR